MTESKKWLFDLTADEWLHLAAEGQDSEVAPCCGDIGQLRDSLNWLATSQEEGAAWFPSREVKSHFDIALESHEVLADAQSFPLLHRVMTGVTALLEAEEASGGQYRALMKKEI